MGRSWLFGLGVVFVLVGCGQVAYDQPPQAQAQCPDTAGGEAGNPEELSELMSELIAPRICDRVVGSFIGLPGDEGHEGPEGGIDPSVGRWWIRRCTAEVVDGQLRVGIGGPGWTWLDRESTGFRVRQYLRFEAEATFTASLSVGYHGRTRIASIWLRPAPGVIAQVRPVGLVRAEATGVFSAMIGGILDLTGSSANDRAQQQATEEGSQRLQERFANGFTVTYQLDSEQMDFMLGQLARGQTPVRPWQPTGIPWRVNERSSIWPGGMDVLGPVAEDAGEVILEVELEEGDGAVVRRMCADELNHWLDAAWSGQQAAQPTGEQVAQLRASHAPQTLRLSALECRSVFLVTPTEQASIPAVLRYRVTSADARPTASGNTAVAQAGESSVGLPSNGSIPPARPRSVRLQIRSVSVASRNGSGSAWDVFGGEPDPYVVVSSIPQRRELERTEPIDDSREARIDRWLPSPLRAEDFPLRFVVYDEDTMNDEVVGTADLEASAMRDSQVDITVDLRSQGESPVQTGVLRIRLQPVD